jgi:hypothetical protein
MAEVERMDGSRKKAKTTEERNADESHTFSEDAPKLSDLAANGGTSADRPSDDNAMAVDDSKAPSKPNGPGGPDSDKQEDKQDLKSIEDEFTQLKEKFFSDKIAAVKAEIEQIELGTHESLKAETKLLESKRTRRTQLAEQIYKYQVLSVDAALRADIKCAEDDYAADVKELRDKTLKTLNKKKKELEEEKRDFSLADSADTQRATTRTLRKRGQAKDALLEPVTPVPAPTATENPKKVPEMRVRLTDEEMDSDMALIQRGLINL